jgi:aminoglycoside phosphotransferase (APT) family kinase protein
MSDKCLLLAAAGGLSPILIFPEGSRLVLASQSSMPERPRSDRDLDVSIALSAVREQLPALECQWATHLGSGWAADVYLLDDRFVARFPRNAEVAQWVDSDQAILGLVTSSLASAFSIPKVVGRGRAGAHFPHDFLVCEFVPGVGADRVTAPVSDELIGDLGRALTRIHSVAVDDARSIGLRQPDWDGYTGTPCFLHGDFSLDNVVLDPASGRLVGVIDWGNAAIGDPALDFVPLVLSRGWKFVDAVLGAYQRRIDEGFVDRVKSNAQIQALQWLSDSIWRRADPELHLTWLRNAFSLQSAS